MTGGAMFGGLSPDAYTASRLRPVDSEHYSAAGILPYRKSADGVEVLLAKEKPWNPITSEYENLGWNVLCAKKISRVEKFVGTTVVRAFVEAIEKVEDAPSEEQLYNLLQNSFALWYPQGKFALLVAEASASMSDLPERYAKAREEHPLEETKVTSYGTKKWCKQIEALEWVPASSLVPEVKGETCDLLQNVLAVSTFSEFLTGVLDPSVAFTGGQADDYQVPTEEGKSKEGKGKGRKGKGGRGKGGGEGGKYSGKHGVGNDSGGKGMPMGGCGMGGYFPMGSPMPMGHDVAAGPGSDELQRQMMGETLFFMVLPLAPSQYIAQKITGMLLELPNNELVINLTNHDELRLRVTEALALLKDDGEVA